MKIIVTHMSPDWDAIGGVWMIKRFYPGWSDASAEYVPAGERLSLVSRLPIDEAIQVVNDTEIIHVDTGMGPLDHHQTSQQTESGTGRAWEFVKAERERTGQQLKIEHQEAISRIVKFIVDTDHFKEVFWPDAANDRYEFGLLGLLEGMKYMKPDSNQLYTDFGMQCLDALLHTFENRIWAEREIKDKGTEFETKKGKGIAFETANDTVLKLAQKMGYILVIRKDPMKGYVRIKVRPAEQKSSDIDLTLAYEQLSKMDPQATWYLHVSKKMLLNGGSKNTKQKPTKLSLVQVMNVLKSIY